MFKLLLVFAAVVAVAYGEPGVVVPVVHADTTLHHHGGHAVHSHVVHHPAPVVKHVVPVVPVKTIVPVHVVKPVVPLVPVVKTVVPVVHAHPVVHHAHPIVVGHH